MITNQEYEELYLLARKIVRFEKTLANKTKLEQDFCNHLESIGFEFDDCSDYEKTLRVIIFDDILNCYFLLGYPQSYSNKKFLLLDLIEYSFYFGETPWSLNEFQNRIEPQFNPFFCKGFEATKKALKSVQFPSLYIELSYVDELKADEYISLLQNVVTTLSKKQNKKTKDELIDVLFSNPKSFLSSNDDNKENQQIEDDRDFRQIEVECSEYNTDDYSQNMNLLKDKLFNGVSFEILKEEYREGYSNPFTLQLRITNFNDKKKKIGVGMKYISVDYGLKDGSLWDFGHYERFLEDNSFVDVDVSFGEIRRAKDGDRIEMVVNEGKFATLKLVRERGQWAISESIERSSFNRDLKNKIEQFEAIEEQFGITLQNFSIKVEDENSMKLFFEILALNSEIPNNDFTINVAIYDNNNEIVYTDSESKCAEDFKGFEVLTFDRIKLDITVDEISKIRIYPTR